MKSDLRTVLRPMALAILFTTFLGLGTAYGQPTLGGGGGTIGTGTSEPDFAVVDFDNSGEILGAYVEGVGVFYGANAETQLLAALSPALSETKYIQFTEDLEASAYFAIMELAGLAVDKTSIGFFDFKNNDSWNGFSSMSDLAYQRSADFDAELTSSGFNESVASTAIALMLLGKKGSGHHSSFSNVIIVVDSDGTTHYPTSGSGLIDVLEDIRDDGDTVVDLIIKGHGSESLIEVGNGGDILTVVNDEEIIIGNIDPSVPVEDITDLLDDVTDSETTINLRGCSTAPLAASIDTLIGGAPTTTGTLLPVVNVPWTPFYVGPYASY